MTRASKTISFSLPPDMADKVEEIRKEEGRTMSELVRHALQKYIEEREWQDLLRYGETRAREQWIAEGDVEQRVDEYRSETP